MRASAPDRRAPHPGPDLPPLVVSASDERAATLGALFDDFRTVSPADLEAALAGSPEVKTVGLTGLDAPGDLKTVLARLRPQLRESSSVLLDVSDATGTALLEQQGAVLRGFEIVEFLDSGPVPCLRLRRAGDVDFVPDLALWAEQLTDAPGYATNVRVAADNLLAIAEAARLQQRVDELERELTSLAASQDADPRPATKLPDPPATPPPTRRRQLLLVAGVAALCAVGISVALAILTSTGYVGAIVTLILFVAVAQAAYTARNQRRALGALNRTRGQLRTLAKAEQARARSAAKRSSAINAAVRSAAKQLSGQLGELETTSRISAASTLDVAEKVARLPREVGDEVEHLGAAGRLHLLQQMQAVANLYVLAPPADMLPPMGGWAASPDLVAVLVDEVRSRAPELVVECGSGVSTLWIGIAARHFGLRTRVVALEHNPRFAAQTRALLGRHGLTDFVEVRDASLVSTGLPGHATAWYDAAALGDLEEIGLLLVDGPPESTGDRARYPAVPLLKEKLAPRATVVLDDLVRASERALVADWAPMLESFTFEELKLEKGAAVFRRE